ncbi:amidase [Thioclava kandeliae]|uniref:Amidase n=1 Tax=Thioclava kandeliae TaxID=3070818 RepID=A0ABV1SEM5_9RHOB
MTAQTIAQQMGARLEAGDAEAVTRAALKLAQTEDTIFVRTEPEAALAQARTCDVLAARGQAMGPLHGVTLAHKDMFDRAGQVTGFGAHPDAARAATGTSTVLARLDAAGQVDLGRLTMSEFAMSPTGQNAHWGVARNPRIPGAVPGGSSSGSGAAIAAGLVRAALGSDTGGSIRLPAACCGVVGFKPTKGRVPVTGVMPLSYTLDCVGPLAASVAEARLVLSIISGADGIDPVCADRPAPRAYARSPQKLRIGFDASAYTAGIAPEMAEGLRRLKALLQDLGHGVVDLDLSLLDTLGEASNVIAMSEAAAVHADRLAVAAERYGPQVRSRLLQAEAMPGYAYVRAMQIRLKAQQQVNQEVFGKVDLFILPTLIGLPPMADAVNISADPKMASLIGSMGKYTRPLNLLGLPALSLPGHEAEGLPYSVQIVGPAWSEDLIADLGQQVETVRA